MADVYAEKTIALRCSLCGKLEHHSMSLFSFSGSHALRIQCSCGFRKAVINMKDHGCFFIQVLCILCEAEHVFSFTAKQIWGAELEGLVCAESGMEMGFLGQEANVKMKAEEWHQKHTGGFDEYFLNPPIMFDVLNHLHRVAENRRLFCGCGCQDIEVDLFPDCLELRCSHCGELIRIPAAEQEDWDTLARLETIIMNRGSVSHEEGAASPILYRLK